MNWFKLFTPDIELYKPEYIKPYFLCSSPSEGKGTVVEAFTPLDIKGRLKLSLILFDSTPFPKE